MIANLKTGRAFEGVAWKVGRRLVVLRPAAGQPVTMIEPDGRSFPVDGEVVIERADVEFYQVAAAPIQAGGGEG